jgi:hypothetical protein
MTGKLNPNISRQHSAITFKGHDQEKCQEQLQMWLYI